jgi:L-fuculose-phosphate aldolase
VLYDLGTIPTAPYATPTSGEGPVAVRELVKRYDALMLDRHGSITVGADLWEAYMRLERIEHSAQVTLAAQQALGKPVQPLPDDAIIRLAAMRRDVFASRGRDVCAECNACPVSENHSSRKRFAAVSSEVSHLETLIANEVRRAMK